MVFPLIFRALHSHHSACPIEAPFLNTHLVPCFTGDLPLPTLVSMKTLVVALLLIATIPTILIILTLLWDFPSTHGLPTVVVPPIPYLCYISCDHDGSSFIPVRIISPTRLRSICTTLRTCTLAWWIGSSQHHLPMPYVIFCMQLTAYPLPHSFLANLTIEMALLLIPCLLLMLHMHGLCWSGVKHSYPAWVPHAYREALRCPPQCNLPFCGCLPSLLSLVGCNLF